MKPTYLIIGGVSLGVLALMSFVKAKTAQATDVFKKMIPSVSLPKRIDISTTRLRFYIDVTLQNPTAQDFYASSGGAIKAKVFRICKGDEVIAFGQISNDISGLNLPAGGQCSFNDIYIEIPTMKLLSVGNDLFGGFDGLKNLIKGGSIGDKLQKTLGNFLGKLTVEADIEALGQIYTFKKTFEQ